MTKFVDGPAVGQTLCLHRAPVFLRVVRAREWDALDQIDDEPRKGEKTYAYKIASFDGMVHINARPRICGYFAMATYRFIEPQPDDATLRENSAWAEWARAEFEKLPESEKAAMGLTKNVSTARIQ